ncbi:MAG: hypothetical protein ACRC9H_04035, partial [Aeromonas veronii]
KQVARPARASTVEAYRHTHRLYISKAIGSLLLKDVTRAVLFAHLSKEGANKSPNIKMRPCKHLNLIN